MTNSQVHTQGWISLLIAPEHEERAKQMRAKRDRQYGNVYAEAATDERWVGDLGEMVFNSWFKHEGIQGFEWVLDDAAGAPDFVTALNIGRDSRSRNRSSRRCNRPNLRHSSCCRYRGKGHSRPDRYRTCGTA